MKIYDKAMWQIDNGMDESIVVKHFQLVFEWLKTRNMLNNDGLEILDIGIDEEVSLNETLLTDNGRAFLDKYYDELISNSDYEISKEKKLLDAYYNEFRV